MISLNKIFGGTCEFIFGATDSAILPKTTLQEIAFVGRSNVGKSSLINALTNRNHLARVSNTPGRTRQINFFSLVDKLMLVDLPGYGYAKVSKDERLGWSNLIYDYLRGRPQLARVCLLIDSRREVKESDIQVMDILDESAVSYQIILTKSDQVPETELTMKITNIKDLMNKHAAMYPEIIVTSSRKARGIEELKLELSRFI